MWPFDTQAVPGREGGGQRKIPFPARKVFIRTGCGMSLCPQAWHLNSNANTQAGLGLAVQDIKRPDLDRRKGWRQLLIDLERGKLNSKASLLII